ncbi:MAG: 30S ribosomal protein S8 [Candidatus Pacebacteria bacterium]|jgi:small subunit ribosomal protein S8|nr:30S ribosomal protein S8 [Candidatus Paceibacterota bacterium]
MTDPIADMIIRVKNAFMANKANVSIPHSKVKEAVAKILESEGYVENFEVKPTVPQKTIEVKLKYIGKIPAITQVRRLSKPGRRMYATSKDIPKSLGGYGVTIVSTSKGVVTDSQARKLNVGGELLCQIW